MLCSVDFEQVFLDPSLGWTELSRLPTNQKKSLAVDDCAGNAGPVWRSESHAAGVDTGMEMESYRVIFVNADADTL